MQRWRGVESAPSGWGRCVVTIGVFDGVHRGHQQIIGRAVERAREAGVPAVVLTFDPHPVEVVRPGLHPPMLTGPRLKAELLEALGVDVMCVLPFTQELSRRTAEEFVHETLVERLHVRAVVVGENFRYGHKGSGDIASLTADGRRFGFTVEAAPLQGSADTTTACPRRSASAPTPPSRGGSGAWRRTSSTPCRGSTSTASTWG